MSGGELRGREDMMGSHHLIEIFNLGALDSIEGGNMFRSEGRSIGAEFAVGGHHVVSCQAAGSVGPQTLFPALSGSLVPAGRHWGY